MRTIIFAIILISFSSCATKKTSDGKEVVFIDKADRDCRAVGSLYSSGMSLIPPVASMVAKNMLLEKAGEFNANKILVKKSEGIFHVKMEAIAYKCQEEALPSHKI